MAFIDDRVFDLGLTVLDTEVDELHITLQQATSFIDATITSSLGSSATVSIGAPQDRTGGGREVVIGAISDGAVSTSGTATHYALVDTVNSRLLAAGSLGFSQPVTSGNTFTLLLGSVGIPDPA